MATQRTFYKCGDCDIYFATIEAMLKHQCVTSKCTQAEDEDTVLENVPEESESECETANFQTDSWNRAATLLLISEYAKLKDRQEAGRMRKKEMFTNIEKTMANNGYRFTVDQITGRWKSLMRAYKSTKDHNKKSGNQRKTFEFESDLDALFVGDPTVEPELTMSSKRSADMTEESSAQETPAKKKPQCDRKSGSRELVDMFKCYLEDKKIQDQQEAERREKMHEERMTIMQGLISALAGTAPKP